MRKQLTAATMTLLAVPALAIAAIDTPEKVIDAICKLSGWLYGVLLAAAIVFIIYSAFLFLTAGEDSGKVTKAKGQLIYAAVAVAVAILATGIIRVTQDLLGAPAGTGCSILP